MSTARRVLRATVLGSMTIVWILVSGCASTRPGVKPSGETATPAPVVDQASSPPTGPPPAYVKPENYWVREKIILTSEPAPPASSTPKRAVKKGKNTNKRG